MSAARRIAKTTGSSRAKAWRLRRQKTGRCMWRNDCNAPRVVGKYYCPRHRQEFSRQQNRRRDYRRQLGLCTYCTDRALPGGTRCATHRKRSALVNQQTRDKRAKTRGWKMVRVNL